MVAPHLAPAHLVVVMKRVADLRAVIREMLALHEALRKLGFPPGDIYASFTRDPAGHALAGITLRAQGRSLDFEVGPIPEGVTAQNLAAEWTRAADDVNAGLYPPADLDELWVSSFVFAHRQSFVARLALHGFKWPRSLQ